MWIGLMTKFGQSLTRHGLHNPYAFDSFTNVVRSDYICALGQSNGLQGNGSSQ
jgi:hypothetical protein